MFTAENEPRGDGWASLLDDIFWQAAVVNRQLAADKEMRLRSPKFVDELQTLKAAAAPLIGYQAVVHTIQPRVSPRGPRVVQSFKQSSWSETVPPSDLKIVKRAAKSEELGTFQGFIKRSRGRSFEVWDIDTNIEYYKPTRIRRSRSELTGEIVAADPAASEIMVETPGYRRNSMWLVRLLNQQEEEFKPLAEVQLLQRSRSARR